MKKIFKGIRKKEQGNKFFTRYIKCHPEDNSPKDLQTQKHVISSHNVEQREQKSVRSDVVIPNELSNCETCKGLRHWRLLFNLKNNFSKPVRNDMNNNKSRSALSSRQLNKLDCFAFARNDAFVKFEDNERTKILKQVQNDNTAIVQNNAKDKNHNELINFKKEFAFTLAEVLITLGIIGIVAAMTIPNLMTKNIQKQTVVKLQKAISIMNQAYKMSFDDVGEANTNEAFEMGADKYFETYWAPYIKTAVLCSTYQQCGYKSNKPWVTASGAVAQVGLIGDTSGSRLPFYTADGTLYLIFVGVGTGNRVDGKPEVKANASILVDINGKDGPNKFGRDVFMLKRIPDGGGVQPFGYDLADSDVEASCKNSWFGNTCAEKIRRAGWRIDKSYPWK